MDSSTFNATSDICQQLLDRYANSAAVQHRHLCATAAATRSILESSSLPLTPLSYFAATLSSLSTSGASLDQDALGALSSFLSIVLPLIPPKDVAPNKANEAIRVLSEIVEKNEVSLGNSSVRALVKCFGVLVGFCDFDDWESIKFGFQTLLKFSIDKRPKVRKCAQECLLEVFKSFESSNLIKEASKLVYSLLKDHMHVAIQISASRVADENKNHKLSTPECQEVLHMLNVLKYIVPCISAKVCSKVLSRMLELMNSHFSPLSKHIFDVMEEILRTSKAKAITPNADGICNSLISYLSCGEKNPSDTLLAAATLAKITLEKLHDGETTGWVNHLSLVIGAVAGLLTYEDSTASQASRILKEMINRHISGKKLYISEEQGPDTCCVESKAIESTCAVINDVLNSAGRVPNAHIAEVVSLLFLRLGKISEFYMSDILLKLAEFVKGGSRGASGTNHIQECIGAAIVSLGPEKVLVLLPISLNSKDFSCSNTWLLPILKKYTIGSSIGFFMEHVVPLAKSFEKASGEVEDSVIGQDLQAYAHECWGLLPSFCRHPSDTDKSIRALVEFLIPFIKNSFMLGNICISLQELINQNKNVLAFGQGSDKSICVSKTREQEDFPLEFDSKPRYSKKDANRNINALASYSTELLKVLTDVLFKTPSEQHEYVKDAIGSLASITDSSETMEIFVASLKRYQLISDIDESGKLEFNSYSNETESNAALAEDDAKRGLILELASSFVDGANEDLINIIFGVTKHILETTDGAAQFKAYQTLSRVLEKHYGFCSSHFAALMDLLLGLKSPANINSLKSRFACFRSLLIHAIKNDVDDTDSKAFLILNELILTLKNSTEEGRKLAYDALIDISSELRTTRTTPDGPYQKLITMIMAYLSGSSPHIRSGAVSALSILVYNDAEICRSMPDLVPSILELLQSKAIEIIKAVLGFVKVLVSSLEVKDLQNFLPDIVNRILPWSSVSRHHFRSKVTVILEIMIRKCGSGQIKSLAPEKYRDFVKNVLENRHGKTSSKEAEKPVNELKPVDPSPQRQQKRKRAEGTLAGNKDRLKKSKGIDPRTSKAHIPDTDDRRTLRKRFSNDVRGKLKRDQPAQHKADKQSNSERGPKGRKRHMHWNKNKADIHKPKTAFKSRGKMGKKPDPKK